VADYAAELKTLTDNMRSSTELQNRMINEKIYDLARDPKKQIAPPKIKEPVPFLNFSQLDNALAQLKNSVEELQKLYPKAMQLPAATQQQLNALLYTTERKLLQEKGLPRRNWYRHQIYAPGYYTGYGVKTLPGIREGIEERQWQEAQDNIGAVTQTLQTYITHVNEINALLK
jgi:N-acetylated-alpha-linked acidic dipeptidase